MLIYRKKHTHINIKAHRKHTLNYLFHIFTNNIILLDTVFFFFGRQKKKSPKMQNIPQNVSVQPDLVLFGDSWHYSLSLLQFMVLAAQGHAPCDVKPFPMFFVS